MPPQPSRQQPTQQMCPVCGGPPLRGSKKGEPVCPACHSGLSDSPLGKRAMAQAAQQRAEQVKQAVSQRRGQQQAIIRGGQGMRPGVPGVPQGQGQPPQGQPQVDPRLIQMLAARLQQGGR